MKNKKSPQQNTDMSNIAVDEETLASDGAKNMPQPVTDESAAGDNETAQPTTPPNVVELKKRRWVPYVVTFAVLAALTLLCAWPMNGYADGTVKELLGIWSSAFAVPGIVCLGAGLLIWCSNEGAFDMLSYGVKAFFRLFRKDVRDRKYGGYYEYQQARRNKKKSFLYMVVSGGVFALVGVVLIIIYSRF